MKIPELKEKISGQDNGHKPRRPVFTLEILFIKNLTIATGHSMLGLSLGAGNR